MTVIVNSGSTLVVPASGLTLTADSTIAVGGVLDDSSYGPITGGFALINDGLITINDPGSLTIDVPSILGTGSIMVNSGTLDFTSSGTLNLPVTFINYGAISVGAAGSPTPIGTVTIVGTVSGPGGFQIENVATSSSINALELDNASSLAVSFGGAVTGPDFGELILDQPSSFTGGIISFNNDSTIILKGIIANSASLNIAGDWAIGYHDTLIVMNNATTVYTVQLIPAETNFVHSGLAYLQDYSDAKFVATPDTSNNDTTITVSGIQDFANPCFRAGTRIDTPSGLVAVENLSPGDIVMSSSGWERPVVWIGHREVDCSRHPDPRSVWPVRIAPNAFAPGPPHSELFLSPDHAVFVDDVLIPVRRLINGTTIQPIETSCVTWYHVELEEHDVLFAEGLAVESYLDQDGRAFFTNGSAPVQLSPDFTARKWEIAGCGPLVLTGARLARVRTMLEQRALVVDRSTRPSAAVA